MGGCVLQPPIRTDLGLLLKCFAVSLHHGRRFCAGDAHFGNQRCGGASLHQPSSVCPLHGIQRPGGNLIGIREACQRIGVRHVDLVVLCVTVQDRCHLLTGDGIVRAEGFCAVALDDLIALRPADRFPNLNSAFSSVTSIFIAVSLPDKSLLSLQEKPS